MAGEPGRRRHHGRAGGAEPAPPAGRAARRPPGDRVADLGCGTGGTLAQAAPAVPGGLVAGLDLSAGALARTAEAVAEAVAGQDRPPGVLLVQADLKDPLPLATASFDRVLCHNVLEVLPDHDALVAEAVRVLRPHGRLVLAHSDFDTLIFASEDLELTRRLVSIAYPLGDLLLLAVAVRLWRAGGTGVVASRLLAFGLFAPDGLG